MWHWFWFNVRCLMMEQIGLFPEGDPHVEMPYEWEWAVREAKRSHRERPWADWYVHVHHYDIVLAEADIPEYERMPF